MTSQSTNWLAAVLDNGATTSFIKTEELSHLLLRIVQTFNYDVNVGNTSEKPVPILGTIILVVIIGTRTETVCFYVVENLTTAVILGCEFCDRYVDATRQCLKIV